MGAESSDPSQSCQIPVRMTSRSHSKHKTQHQTSSQWLIPIRANFALKSDNSKSNAKLGLAEANVVASYIWEMAAVTWVPFAAALDYKTKQRGAMQV